jgi:uncharacterized protein YegP (UPF0339 family)
MAKKTRKSGKTVVQRTGIRFETFPDAANQYRWRMVDGNNRIVASSGESFTRERDARRAVENVIVDLAEQALNPKAPMPLVAAKRVK